MSDYSNYPNVLSRGRTKITHIITGLGPGGAEVMLARLLENSNRSTFSHKVISLTQDGVIGDRIRSLNIPVQSLGLKWPILNPVLFIRFSKWLRDHKPNVIQTWLYHADLVGGLIAKLSHIAPVVWGVHHSNLLPKLDRQTTIWVAKTCARLSRWLPKKIICCSETTRRVHTKLGYPSDRMTVITNGFDLTDFYPDPEARFQFRKELGIKDGVLLIGMAGRFHPQKDHQSFIQAARIIKQNKDPVRFLLCGSMMDTSNSKLMKLLKDSHLSEDTLLLGYRDDMHRIYSALDLFTLSSSHGEAFPNVIGEAMACGVPCVVTDVGDSGYIVGDTGLVVPPQDPQELARAWENLINQGEAIRTKLGLEARERIRRQFGINSVVGQYEAVYRQIADEAR